MDMSRTKIQLTHLLFIGMTLSSLSECSMENQCMDFQLDPVIDLQILRAFSNTWLE
jgi:hypothetical protein